MNRDDRETFEDSLRAAIQTRLTSHSRARSLARKREASGHPASGRTVPDTEAVFTRLHTEPTLMILPLHIHDLAFC